MGSELRRDPRVSLRVEIDVHTETNFYTGFATDISAGGLFIATHVPAEIGEKVPLTFKLPNVRRPLVVTGTVRWFREFNQLYPDTHPGMGLSFDDISDEDAKIINEYITSYREPYFHPDDDDD